MFYWVAYQPSVNTIVYYLKKWIVSHIFVSLMISMIYCIGSEYKKLRYIFLWKGVFCGELICYDDAVQKCRYAAQIKPSNY